MNQPYRQTQQPYPYGGYVPPNPYQLMQLNKPIRRYSSLIGGSLILVELIMVLLYLLLGFVFSAIDYDLLSYETWDLLEQGVEAIVYTIAFWVPTAFLVLMIRIPARTAFPMRRPKASIAIPAVFVCLGASIIGSMLSGVISVFMETVFDLVPIMPDMSLPTGVGANIVYVISLAILPPIFEELLFRGVIMQSLRRFGDGFALIASAILFGLMHGNLVQGPNAFLTGLLIGYFVLRTGSLLTGMLIHFANNGLAVLFTYLMENMTEPQANILYIGMVAGYLLSGIIALVYLVVRRGRMFQLAPSDYPLPEAKKYKALFTTFLMIAFLLTIVWQTWQYLV